MRGRGMHGNAGIFVKADTYMSSVIWNSAPSWRKIFCARPRQLRVIHYRADATLFVEGIGERR